MKKFLLLLWIGVLSIPVSIAQTDSTASYPSLPSKYFFSNSSYSLRKGHAYYSNTDLLINNFNYGITNHLTAGLGFIPLPKGLPSIFWFSGKISYPISPDHFAISGGVSYTKIIGVFDLFGSSEKINTGLLMSYVGFTIGSMDNNFSMNFYPYYNKVDNLFTLSTSLSGRAKISPRTHIMGEFRFVLFNVSKGNDEAYKNSTFNGPNFIGFRTYVVKGIMLDYGLISYILTGTEKSFHIIPVPYLALIVPFVL